MEQSKHRVSEELMSGPGEALFDFIAQKVGCTRVRAPVCIAAQDSFPQPAAGADLVLSESGSIAYGLAPGAPYDIAGSTTILRAALRLIATD